jgi:uncharacterized protein YjbJ (UPF0337 family)
MSVKGKIEEAAGYVEEEAGELVGSNSMTKKGRSIRNAGRLKDGKAPKATPPGSGN